MKKIVIILGMFFVLSANAQQVSISGPANICAGQTTPLIAQVPGLNTDTLIFQWLLNSQPFGAPNNDSILVGPTVGSWNFSVSVFTPQGLLVFQTPSQSTGTITLIINPLPTATATNSGPHCVGTTINLMAGGGSSYSWTGPNGFSSLLQNPQLPATMASNGTYTVTVTNSNSCSASANTTVVVNPSPTPPTTGSNSPVCVGGTISLIANSGYASYTWSGPNGFSSLLQNPVLSNATLAMSGAYQVNVTDGNGCGSGTGFNVVVNSTPAVTAVATNTTCFGGSNASITTNVFGGSSFSYLWSTGATTVFVSGLPAGSYSVTVTNNFGCSASANAVVNQPSAAVSVDSLIIANASCSGFSNGSIGVNASGGVGFYSYSWTGNGSGSNPRTNLSAGSYTVTVTDGNGCSTTATGTVGQPTLLVANANGGSVNCNGNNNGSAVVAVVGGTSPYSYLWSNGGMGDTLVGLTAGNYNVTVTDANGCTTTAATAVTQPTQVAFTFIQTNVTCNNGNNGGITATATGGIGTYQYRLNGGAWVSNNVFSGLTAGNYTIMARDANGCTAGPTTVNLTQPNILVANAVSTPQGCNYLGQASVLVSGGQGPYSFLWSNSLGVNDSITAVAGTYTVLVTDANGCQMTGTAVIAAPTPVTIAGTPSNVSCFGGNNGSVDITPSGVTPFTYVWSNGTTAQDLTGVGAGIYTVIVTAANGCITTNQFTVFQPANLTANASATAVGCYGGSTGSASVTVNGGSNPYSFQWSPSGGNGSTATNLAAGAYTVTVTDANGCTAQASTVVIQPSQLVASIQNQTNAGCFGNNNGSITVIAAGGTQPYSPLVQWSDGFVGGPVRTGLSAGNYTATITDANGCTASVTTTINGPTSPIVVQWYTVQNPCSGTNNGGITVNASGGVGPYTFTWGDGFVGPIRTGLSAGTYTVTITDATGCQAGPFGQTLAANQSIVITTPSVVNYCVGSGETISLTATGGTQPYGYQWTSPNGTFFGTAQAIEPMVNGQYLGGIWTGVVTDGLGCSQTTYITVNLITCTTTSINEQSNDGFNVVVYPNPISFGGVATVQLPLNIYDVTIQLIDLTGKILFQEKASGENHQLNTSGISSGTYLVRIASGSEIVTKRLIIQ